MSNAVYWMMHPLEENFIRVLKHVKAGIQPFFRDRFEVAYLIAEECITADLVEHTLTITPKGLDGLQFFGD